MPAAFGRAITEDQRLPRGVAEFLQAANSERQDKHGEAAGEPERDREESEERKRRQDERLATMFVGKMGNRDDAEAGDDDLDTGEEADFLRVHADVIHGVDHDPRERDPLAEPHQNIASSRRRRGASNARRLCRKFQRSRHGDWRSQAISRNWRWTKIVAAGKEDRDRQANADAIDHAETIDEECRQELARP